VVHVVARALEDFDVALLLAENHVLVVTLLCRQEGVALGAHLDESLAGRLTLTLRNTLSTNQSVFINLSKEYPSLVFSFCLVSFEIYCLKYLVQ
jgi:hypothetical protein